MHKYKSQEKQLQAESGKVAVYTRQVPSSNEIHVFLHRFCFSSGDRMRSSGSR